MTGREDVATKPPSRTDSLNPRAHFPVAPPNQRIETMRRACLVLTLLFTACADQPVTDESAETPVSRLETFVHEGAWDSAPRFLRFDFRIRFNGEEFLLSQNLWDRHTGRYRTEWKAVYEEGESMGLVNMNGGGGRVFRDGQELTGEDAAALIGGAEYRAVNDSYWLIAPFKFSDPGTRLERQDEAVHLSFDEGVGNDHFWLYLDPESGKLDRWAFFLESFEGEPSLDQASVWRWESWEELEGVMIARRRIMEASPQFAQFQTGEIDFPVLQFMDSVDDAVFEDPSVALP